MRSVALKNACAHANTLVVNVMPVCVWWPVCASIQTVTMLRGDVVDVDDDVAGQQKKGSSTYSRLCARGVTAYTLRVTVKSSVHTNACERLNSRGVHHIVLTWS